MKYCLLLSCFLGAQMHGQPSYDFTELDRILSSAAASTPGGLGLVLTQNGRTIYDKSFGGFDNQRAIPIASASKWLSGAGVMAAVDAGKVTLDDPIAKFVPSFGGEKAGIRLYQAFSHTAGFPPESALNPTGDPETACLLDRATTLERCVDEIARLPLVAPPGTQFAYGSLSMQSAGRMVEVATGVPWTRWMGQRILEPLGMQRTLVGLPNRDANPLVAGGYASTASDYSRFVQMILNGGVWEGKRVLSAESVEQMRTDQTNGARIVSTPYERLDPLAPGLARTRYGVGGWLTPEPQTPSIEMSSQGAFGFSPWVDYSRNLTGVLAVNDRLANVERTYLELRGAIARIVPAAALTYAGVTNAASFATGALSPGEIVVLFGEGLGGAVLSAAAVSGGRFPLEWQGTRLNIDGQAAPILYTSARQIAAVVPYGVAGKAGVSLEVVYQGRGSGTITMPLAAAAPALFAASGVASALNEDGTLHGEANRAGRGSVLVLYGTGFGTLEGGAADGAILSRAQGLSSRVGVTIGGEEAEVLYAGSAPGLVAGAVQINVRVPARLGAGRHAVRVEAAGIASRKSVDVFVR